MHVPPRIRHGTCMYPDVYERVHTCTPSYTLGYMYVPPRIRQGTCMYPLVYVWVHGCTQSFSAGYLTYSITGAKWVYLTICTQSRYTYVPYRAYMHVPPRIRHGTWMYPAVYEGVHTCTPSYTLGYMYVPPRIRQGTCMYPHVYVRVHRYTQSFAAGYLTYSITGRLSWFSVSTVSDYRRSFPL